MQPLFETQARFRSAVAGGPAEALLRDLCAPARPEERLEIYRRHYRESFRRHLRGRFPTLEWLIGTDRMLEVADDTLRRAPPQSPCLAEYGAGLIDALSTAGDDLPPYLRDAARLDWALGCVSVAVAHVPMPLTALAAVDPQDLPQLTLVLQPGAKFMTCEWPVDELVHLRHQNSQPDKLVFGRLLTHLQLRGARGQFSIARLDPGVFAFREALAMGGTLGQAAIHASTAQPGFDLPSRLAALFAEGLVVDHSGETHYA